jgi:hypothetical protein
VSAVQVSPVEIQAWAEETGNPYPATPAEKAAVMPAVISWKQQELADARANRGDNALAVPLLTAAGAGLGIAGLIAYNHFRKQGDSEVAAADKAKATENIARQQAQHATAAATSTQAAAPPAPAGPFRAVYDDDQAIRPRNARYGGPRLIQGNDPQAAELVLRTGTSMGSAQARKQGQYAARDPEDKNKPHTSLFHDPAMAGLDSPLKREAYLAAVAEQHGTDSDAFRQAQRTIGLLEVRTPEGVDPTDFIADRDSSARYGSTTAAEQQARADAGETDQALAQSRTKANRSAQAGYRARDEAEAYSWKPDQASVFYQDSDGSLRPYRGAHPVRDQNGAIKLHKGRPEYSGLKSDGTAIAQSDLQYFPTDDPEFYERTGLQHPALSMDEIYANYGSKPDLRYSDEEDQSIKGMLEPLPVSDPRFSTGIRDSNATDNWSFTGADIDGTRAPLDLSGFQSELNEPATLAGSRLRGALDDYRSNTGQKVPESVTIAWATDLARQHSVDTASVLRSAGFQSTAPAPEKTPRKQAHALAAGTAKDALDRIYHSLGMHAGADVWELEGMVRSGNIKDAAAAMAPMLPALTSANSKFLRGASDDEKLNVVAEGLTAGLHDLAVTLNKHPEQAAQFGVGQGAGGYGVDAYIKSYVRDWVTVRSLQLDPTGQPTYQLPNDAFELLAYDAAQNNRSVLHELESTIRGSSNGLDAALKLDRMVSAAQSTRTGDPNTNATNLAQAVFSSPDPDLISTKLTQEAASDIRLSFSTRRNYDASAGFINKPGAAELDQRLSDYYGDDDEIAIQPNAVLKARISSADPTSADGKAQKADAIAKQQWINSNARSLERLRDDLNRGVIDADDGPKTVGRGIVITSDDRGAYLAGDTIGVNTSYREEQINDEDLTPLDRAQDVERDMRINNDFIAEEPVVASSDRGEAVPITEAERTAKAYGSQKLYFKNLGPGSNGAMAEGDAVLALDRARQWQQSLPDTLAYYRSLNPWTTTVTSAPDATGVKHVLKLRHPSPNWQPESGHGIEVGASEPVRVPYGPTLAPRQGPSIFPRANYWEDEPLPRIWSGNSEPVDNRAVLDLPGEYEPTRVTRPEGLKDGAIDPYDSWYRPAPVRQGTVYGERPITLTSGEVVSIPTIALHGTWAPRPAGRQPLTNEQIFEMYGMPRRDAVVPEVNTKTAALHRDFLAERGGFRDDQNARDVRTASENLYDAGDATGYGRRGSTFAQTPLSQAPVSVAEEIAKVSHYRDYIDSLNRQFGPAAGSPVFNMDAVPDYNKPSPAMVAARVKGLRQRGILR